MLTRTNATRQYFDRTKDINLIHILTFMQVLFACRSPLVVSIVRSMIISIAYLLDTSLPVWAEASTDALIDCPVPVAHKRSRRIDPSLKRAIGHAIAQRVGGATAGKMHQTMSRFRKRGAKRFGVEICSSAVGGRVRSYIRNGKEKMHKQRHVSISLDGTRMSGKDTLYCALYAPRLKQAVWLPPQVLMGAIAGQRAGRKCTKYLADLVHFGSADS